MIPVSRQKVVPVPVSVPLEVSNSVSASKVVEVTQPQPHHAVFVSHTSAPVLTIEQQLQQQEPEPVLVESSSSNSGSNSNGDALTSSTSPPQQPQPPIVSSRVLDRLRNRRTTTNNNHDSNSTTPHPELEEPQPLTIHTIVSEPESPSPILEAWSTPHHLNPDYLAPYHPSLHKNVHNWSQILLDQLRQKSASSPDELEPPGDAANNGSGEDQGKVFSIQAALSSSVPGIAPAAPATFEGISNASIAIASSSANAGASSSSTSPSTAATRRRQQVYVPAPIDKHFLFQTHHRERQPVQQQKPQSGNSRKHSSRTQSRAGSPVSSSSSLTSLESGAGAGKRIRRETIRSLKELVRFFKRLFRSMRSEQQQQQQPTISSSPSAEERKRRKSKSKTKSKQRDGRAAPPVLPPPHITNNANSNNTDANSNNIAAADGGQQNHKDKNKDTDGTFNYLVVSEDDEEDETLDVENRRKQRRESLVQIVSSAEREDEVVARSLSLLTVQPAQPTGGPPPDTAALRAVPKMMNVINRIKNQVHKAQEAVHLTGKQAPTPAPVPAPVPETVIPIPEDTTPAVTAVTAVPAVVVPPQKQYFNGARIHPTLLELYEITDHVLGVGTFATVREIRLKSTGQSFALKIILKKTLQGTFLNNDRLVYSFRFLK